MHTHRSALAPIAFVALAALLALSLACDTSGFGLAAGSSTPSGPPNFYLSSDKAGTHPQNGFGQTDTVYLLIDTKGLPPGVTFDVKWYGPASAAQDPNTVLAYQTVSHDGVSPVIEVWFSSSDKLPVGGYRVDVYEDGSKIGETQFTVQ